MPFPLRENPRGTKREVAHLPSTSQAPACIGHVATPSYKALSLASKMRKISIRR